MPLDNMTALLIAALAVGFCGFVWLVREAMGRKRSERMETYLRLKREAGTDRGRTLGMMERC